MEVFQNLKLFVPVDKEEVFIDNLMAKAVSSNWKNKNDFESSYKKNTASLNEIVFCFESHDMTFNKKTLRAFVWMWKKKDFYEVFNIVPSKSGSLDYGEYNFILNAFYKELLYDIVEKLKINADFSKPNKSMVDLIGKVASESLLQFSKNANKITGNSHPFDFERWCEFVFIIHRNKIPLNIDDFVRWLEEEEDWTNDVACRLGLDLEYALNILEKYEQH
jgi:hypothetical protein